MDGAPAERRALVDRGVVRCTTWGVPETVKTRSAEPHSAQGSSWRRLVIYGLGHQVLFPF